MPFHYIERERAWETSKKWLQLDQAREHQLTKLGKEKHFFNKKPNDNSDICNVTTTTIRIRSLSDIQTLAFGSSLYIRYRLDHGIVLILLLYSEQIHT